MASRVLGFGLAALLLILINSYTDWLKPLRSYGGLASAPFYWVTDIPARVGLWLDDLSVSREDLRMENTALKTELLVHQRKLQQMASLAAENVRLRQLLNSADSLQDRVLIAELIGVSPDPHSHVVILNKGSSDGVYVGQPLLGAEGLMGQVLDVSPYTCRVLLITDGSHALPVQVNRNGVRAIAAGIGDLHRMQLRHVSNTVDIRAGDLLVSSGLGQRFPVGYPVAEVESVEHDPGQSFATVYVKPRAKMNRSRHVLLVFSDREQSLSAEALE